MIGGGAPETPEIEDEFAGFASDSSPSDDDDDDPETFSEMPEVSFYARKLFPVFTSL